MQAELRQLQPVLEKTAVEVEAMMVRITADKKEAAVTQKAVAQQEQEANEQAAHVHSCILLAVAILHWSMHQCIGLSISLGACTYLTRVKPSPS